MQINDYIITTVFTYFSFIFAICVIRNFTSMYCFKTCVWCFYSGTDNILLSSIRVTWLHFILNVLNEFLRFLSCLTEQIVLNTGFSWCRLDSCLAIKCGCDRSFYLHACMSICVFPKLTHCLIFLPNVPNKILN